MDRVRACRWGRRIGPAQRHQPQRSTPPSGRRCRSGLTRVRLSAQTHSRRTHATPLESDASSVIAKVTDRFWTSLTKRTCGFPTAQGIPRRNRLKEAQQGPDRHPRLPRLRRSSRGHPPRCRKAPPPNPGPGQITLPRRSPLPTRTQRGQRHPHRTSLRETNHGTANKPEKRQSPAVKSSELTTSPSIARTGPSHGIALQSGQWPPPPEGTAA